MTTGAVVFMALSWTFILGLTLWCFARLLRGKEHFDPDGIGPGVPPKKGAAER